MDAFLIRFRESDQGTLGLWLMPGFECKTIELPWRGNKPDISCIPTGDYECKLYHSKKFGLTYHVQDVPGRSWILTHRGNWAGDKTKGYRTNSYGCILMGQRHAIIYGQMAVAASRLTMAQFLDFTGGEDFTLHIRRAY